MRRNVATKLEDGERLALEAIERFRENTLTLVQRASVDPTAVVLGLMAAAADVAVAQLQRDPRLFRVYGEGCKAALDRMVQAIEPAGRAPLRA
jgi:hypothetical protein